MKRDVTVCIPTIPPREHLLVRALRSVTAQSHPVSALAIALDSNHDGAAVTRQRALDMATTEWVAFLDDDDEFLGYHLEALLRHAEATNADYVYSWFWIAVGEHRFDGVFPPHHFTDPFNPQDPIQTTITVLVKRELAQEAGFYRPLGGVHVKGQTWGEDYQFTLECLRLGANIQHLVERTWLWHHDSSNTSGRGDRW